MLGREDEGVDDENLAPVTLGDFVHLRVGAALDQKGAFVAADPLEAIEKVADELDLEVFDALKGHIPTDRPLVAGAGRPERDNPDWLAGAWTGHPVKIRRAINIRNFKLLRGFLDMVGLVH
jgi:hypothetical protein